MRYLIAFLLMLSALPACSEPGPKGAPGPAGMNAPLTEIEALQQQIKALETRLNAAPKQVHLIAKAGTNDERDLGAGAPGSRCAWNTEAGGEVCFDVSDLIRFAGSDCSGAAFYLSPNRRTTPLRSADGRIFAANGPAIDATLKSEIQNDGKCLAFQGDLKAVSVPLKLLSTLPVYDPADLTISPR